MAYKILVVEDEPMLLRVIVRALRDRGYAVVEAMNGLTALQLARSTSVPFDLVITDSVMPELSGLKLIEILRTLNPTLPIVHLSGSLRGDTFGYQGLPPDVPTLFKPFHPAELIQRVQELLRGTAE
jgi:two-component system, cell cycle sensor histidine kinase and response regulator CckA